MPMTLVSSCSCRRSGGQRPLLQSAQGVERRSHGAFLPGRHIRGVFTGQNDAAVECAEIVVVLLAGLVRPKPEATQGGGDAMPRHGDAIVEFFLILRMNLTAVFERFG